MKNKTPAIRLRPFNATIRSVRLGLLGGLLAFAAVQVLADDLDLTPVTIGRPSRIEVFPRQIDLTGRRQQMYLIVTGYYADGTIKDLTRSATIESSDNNIVQFADGRACPQHDGEAQLIVTAGSLIEKVNVTVSGQDHNEPVSFRYQTLPVLSKHGCSSGACHGSPSGKGGFRLSLRAFDPELDKLTLVRESLGRRTDLLHPEESLMLAKPLMRVPHGGGLRLTKQDDGYALLHDWIAEGCRFDAVKTAQCVGVTVYPPSGRVFKRPAYKQQLAVLARFSDGSVRDVTRLAVYSSSDEAVATVDEWGLVSGQDRGEVAVIIRYLEHITPTYFTFVKDIDGFAWQQPPANNYIDELVYEKLEQLKYVPANTSDDATFVRRVYLDIIGLLPTIEQTQVFLDDRSPDRRRRLIDQLLSKPEFAKFWALKWSDLLRVSVKQVGSDGARKYHQWIERAVARNMPYDQFATQLLTASGSTLVNPPANYYRAAVDTNDTLESTVQIFLGSRIQCAKCHNHPFERWTQDNYYGLAAFFNRVERQKSKRAGEMFISFARTGEVTQPRTGEQVLPWAPDVGPIDIPAGQDRRPALARWLTSKDNRQFATVEVNRLWSYAMGSGIVEPFDDFRDTNPPTNAKLLDALTQDFIDHNFDRKHILRTIFNSRAYQVSSHTNEWNRDDPKYGSHFEPRMLSAEQLLDAISQVVDVAEQFDGVPLQTRATQLPSPDLAKSDFLKVFGQPERQTACQCERSSDSNLGQALQLYNGPLVYEKLRDENNRFRSLAAMGKSNDHIIEQLYLAAYCRRPRAAEMEASQAYLDSRSSREEGLEDICWAILNTNEFLFQH